MFHRMRLRNSFCALPLLLTLILSGNLNATTYIDRIATGKQQQRGSPQRGLRLLENERNILLNLAKTSILYGVEMGSMAKISNTNRYRNNPVFGGLNSCFVSLYKRDHNNSSQLRGCIGTFSRDKPLAENIIRYAYSSAFEDLRFQRIVKSELADLTVEISVLTPEVRIRFKSEQDLLKQLQPGIDGLILKDDKIGYQATYLPTVWKQIPVKRDFVRQLKRKGNLAENYWSPTMQAFRYYTLTFSGEWNALRSLLPLYR